MKLLTPFVWKSGLAALGMLSLVSLPSVAAQDATTTPATSSIVATGTPAAGNGAPGANSNMPGQKDQTGSWSQGAGKRGDRDPGLDDRGGMHGDRAGMMGVAGVDAATIADFLGLTTEQLKADRDAGQSLSQIAVAQGRPEMI